MKKYLNVPNKLVLSILLVIFCTVSAPAGRALAAEPVEKLALLSATERTDSSTATASTAGPMQRKRPKKNDSAFEKWFWTQRIYPAQSNLPQAERSLLAEQTAESLAAVNGPVRWSPIGPAPLDNMTMYGAGDLTASGRALSIVIHPSQPEILLLGAAQGGIWRSTNGGRNFLPVSDNMPSLAIKVIRYAPGNANILYAGSGEPHSKTSIFGMGVFKSTDGGQTWRALPAHGPGWDFRYVAVSGLQIDPSNSDVVYVTTANVLADRVNAFLPPPSVPATGIFKSTDGGRTWSCKQQAVDYRSYMYPEYDPYLVDGLGFMDLELFQPNPAVLFATEFSGGIYRSTDFGESWQRVTPVKNPGGGAAAGPDFPAPVPRFAYYDPNAFQFTTYDVIAHSRQVPEFSRIEIGLGQAGAGVTSDYRTAVIYAGIAAVLNLDSSQNGSFVKEDDLQSAVGLLFKSTDGGDTWEWLGDWLNGIPNYCDTFQSIVGDHVFVDGVYDNTVEVNPSNADDVIIGGNANYNEYWPDPIDQPWRMLAIPWRGMVYRSVDGGKSWTDTTPACLDYVLDGSAPPVNGLPVYKCVANPSHLVIHPDVHSAAYDWPNQQFYATTDGGLSRCSVGVDSAAGDTYSWESLNNNLGTMQFFNFGSHPFNPDFIIGSMQDNATGAWNGTFWDAWDWYGGDGTVAVFDPVDPRHVYAGWQFALARNDKGGNNNPDDWKTLFDSSIGRNDTLPFVTIFEIDPVFTNIVYVGSNTGIYRSASRGDRWQPRLNAVATDGEVTAISVSPVDHNLVWVGTSTGRIYRLRIRQGRLFERLDTTGFNLPNRWITRIEASQRDAGGAIITFSGYDAASRDVANGGNGNIGRVFRTMDFGRRWQNISGNLTVKNNLDLPVSGLAVDSFNENHIWIGTDIGVFQTRDGGFRWTSFRGNMPIVAVMSLDFNPRTGYLSAATFGRSIWRTLIMP